MNDFALFGASEYNVAAEDGDDIFSLILAVLRSSLPGLPLPDDLKNYSIFNARFETVKMTTVAVTHPKNPKILPQYVITKPHPYKEVITLPQEVNEKLTKFAHVYLACRFTVKFLEYIRDAKNRVQPIIGTTPELQEKLVYHRDNPANMPFLDFRIKDAEKFYTEQLMLTSFKPGLNPRQLNWDESNWFIQDAKSKCEVKLKKFFSQQKSVVLRLSGYKEFQITPESVVDDPRVRAMLDLINYSEGTGAGYGTIVKGVVKKSPYYPELIGQRNVVITDFSRFPEISADYGPDWSTAAGRYQINSITWKDFGRGDFSPRSQDLAAVRIMIKENMVESLLNGNIKQAIFAGGTQRWMSFPFDETGNSAAPGQHAKPVNELLNKYNEFLTKY